MPIFKIENEPSLKSKKVLEAISKKIFIADTSFILDVHVRRYLASTTHEKCLKLNSSFFCNVTVYNELIDRVFRNILGEIIYSEFKRKQLNWYFEEGSQKPRVDDRLIKRARKDNSLVLKKASKELKLALKALNTIFPYLSTSSTKGVNLTGKLSWKKMESLIHKYYLGSSDAMIANFVLSYDQIDGLITSDKDFLHCKEFERPDKFLVWVNKKNSHLNL